MLAQRFLSRLASVCSGVRLGNASRWDVISYQFGLHDLALDNEVLIAGATPSGHIIMARCRIMSDINACSGMPLV